MALLELLYAITTSNDANGQLNIIDVTYFRLTTSMIRLSGNSSMEFGRFGINTIHLDGESFLLASLHKSAWCFEIQTLLRLR